MGLRLPEKQSLLKKLPDKDNVDFCAFGLNATYRLKVLLRLL